MYPTESRLVRLKTSLSTFGALCAVAVALALPTPALLAQQAAPRDGAYDVKTADLVLPTAVHKVRAVYTDAAKRRGIQGRVEIAAVIDRDGTVSKAHVTKSLDADTGLDAAALTAALAWTFEPGRLHGQAVPVNVDLEFRFTLR